MQELQILVDEPSSQVRVLRLIGPLTLNTLFEFQNLVRKGDRTKGLILELAEVPYMDSAGLGSVLGAFTSCQTHGQKFALANVSDRVLTLLQLAKVDKLVPRFDSLATAEKQVAAKA